MGKTLNAEEKQTLITVLAGRFKKNTSRHTGITWEHVLARLEANPEKWWSLHQMEISGGEPDVVDVDAESGAVLFFDCAAESPKERRSLCYDRAAWEARKEHKPSGSVEEIAGQMGVEVLDEADYRQLQKLGKFDQKTSSWLKTPEAIRQHGGAIFGDFRYEHVFIYHNGVQSYYAARGFRSKLRV